MLKQWAIGDVTITVETPEGVEIEGAMVKLATDDRAAFLRNADAVGGLEALEMPREEEGWRQSAIAYMPREDQRPDTRVYVSIPEPPRDEREPAQSVPPHPFFGPLAARVNRDRVLDEQRKAS